MKEDTWRNSTNTGRSVCERMHGPEISWTSRLTSGMYHMGRSRDPGPGASRITFFLGFLKPDH
ncbi:unnamed protein product [Dovyalis caffra]|uniref:Uncharacterized protein n=1 Tax=Dovyalis caffra TaxID=77055 RepID=A0AAV1SKA5_9ROSI|nr:unnamed protein product [Dovyalis caffra]